MTDATAQPVARLSRGPRRRRESGFSFTEVLFAVMILGIGFIMIAAIFPVSLTQVQATNSETTAASVARGATLYLEGLASGPGGNEIFQPTLTSAELSSSPTEPMTYYGGMWSMRDSRMGVAQRPVAWGAVAGNLIVPSDPRYAWVAAYRRDVAFRRSGTAIVAEPSRHAQVIVAVAHSRNRPIFAPGDDVASNPINLAFREGTADFVATTPSASGPATPGSVTFRGGDAAQAAAEGAYVIVAGYPSRNLSDRHWMSGRVFRLGAQDPSGKWDLVPGAEFNPDPGPDGSFGTADDVTAMTNVPVLLLGKGYNGTTLEGPAMDVSVYTAYVDIR